MIKSEGDDTVRSFLHYLVIPTKLKFFINKVLFDGRWRPWGHFTSCAFRKTTGYYVTILCAAQWVIDKCLVIVNHSFIWNNSQMHNTAVKTFQWTKPFFFQKLPPKLRGAFCFQSTIMLCYYLKSARENSAVNNYKVGHNRWQNDDLEHRFIFHPELTFSQWLCMCMFMRVHSYVFVFQCEPAT